jgi:hypothetical protein
MRSGSTGQDGVLVMVLPDWWGKVDGRGQFGWWKGLKQMGRMLRGGSMTDEMQTGDQNRDGPEGEM